jgi:DNA invertase Pin-like site-specific DNA recombinase
VKIGYARISTDDQSLSLQLDALNQAGCQHIFRDIISGAKAERPGLTQALDHLRPGDVLVVWRLDRLGRSLRSLVELMNQLADRRIGFQSLNEQVETVSPSGKLIFHLFAALAEFERDLIRERTRAGLAAARARGRVGGQPRVEAFNSPRKLAIARALYEDKRNTIRDICQTLGVSRSTLYRYLRPQAVQVAAS